jgi:uncharacterized protein (DUF1800 family)
MLKSHCAGTFKDLLHAVSKDPAMIYWLDNQLNVVGKPNENFAREVMELFTIGIGNYTEQDVKQAARAFTGWRYGVRRGQRVIPNDRVPGRQSEFLFVANQHDQGQKEFRGSKAPFNGEDVLDILAIDPLTAKAIVKKFWEWFAYPNPEATVIEQGANAWRKSGMEIKALVKWVMESQEFYSERATRAIIKNPVDFAIPAARALGLGSIIAAQHRDGVELRRLLPPVQNMQRACKAMGMDLLYPPDVAGWNIGKSWISTATMVERIKLADSLFNPRSGALATNLIGSARDSEEVASRLVSLFDATLPPAKLRQLATAAEAHSQPAQKANAVAKLILGSPEFQFC